MTYAQKLVMDIEAELDGGPLPENVRTSLLTLPTDVLLSLGMRIVESRDRAYQAGKKR